MRISSAVAVLLLGSTLLLGSFGRTIQAIAEGQVKQVTGSGEVKDTAYPDRAYFGDTHVHTGWSADAGIDGAILGPEDAFRFARGDEVTSNSGQKAKLNRALDWMVITDHSDGMGTISEIRSGNPEMIGNDEFLKRMNAALKSSDANLRNKVMLEAVDLQVAQQLPKAMTDPKWMVSAWKRTIEIADRYNEPGKFTAMIGYEWTVNADDGNNLHRNVVLRDGADKAGQVLPLTSFETQDPEGLWKWMADYEAKTGGKALAIPHNGNLSNGRMFEETRFDRSPMTREYASARQRWEPLVELTQMKGQSESHPSLSPNDEFANWDLWDRGNLNGVLKEPGMVRTEYWREALKSGLRLQGTLGANPFKIGANAGTDTHTALSAAEENNYWGKLASIEPSADRMTRPFNKQFLSFDTTAAGYMGVWAKANTREALWDAMQRRETFATTGPRMTVRFFGGYDFAAADLGNLVRAGYTRGVPMGGDLKPAPAGKAPTFLVAAMKDPQGANLDRVQVIKGWVDARGQTHEQVYEVKWAGARKPGANGKLPAVGNTVNLKTATYSNSIGAAELVGLWRDPGFDPKQRAVYYVRVLEIPTPRWTAYDQVRFKVPAPAEAQLIHQERAFTSPIWYTPS
ncbi:DUF3604 domain-containing protein [Candidatus Phycosocius spiralis]|uniref:DUF3604 domain-containing protein n=1 Tax=Candidatus Phycosocius spiralis TaxID=2815099 RepID=A0ABQ4PVZ2_9PROT|nr:DUF3604 domain-containing protein [Candidatus Phycosocius spiralis]GIU67152.1 hypothetical protein PsB1_1306 [Candidatus Phycosocius spiralis]